MILVTERFVSNVIHNRQVLKYTNKTCHTVFGKSLNETGNYLQKNKYTGKIINTFKNIYEWGNFLSHIS